MSQAGYVTSQYRNDPLGFLVQLMSLEPYEQVLRRMDLGVHILSGIVTYRCLRPSQKMDLTRSLYEPLIAPDSPKDVKRTMSHLYGVGSIAANPYWYAWSLNDDELREYYRVNHSFASAIEYLGLDFDSSLSVVGIAGGILAISKSGLRGAAGEVFKDKGNVAVAKDGAKLLGLPDRAARALGMCAAMVTVFAGVLHAQASASSDQARRELLLRGLLAVEEF